MNFPFRDSNVNRACASGCKVRATGPFVDARLHRQGASDGGESLREILPFVAEAEKSEEARSA